LSRACLGEMVVLVQNGEKDAFSHLRINRVLLDESR